MAGSGKVASTPGEFVACARRNFLAASTSMVAQRFPNEPALTQSAITATTGQTFHKQFHVQVNGAVYAQPLVLPNVVIGGTTHSDVAFVATEQDNVYAINGATGNIAWGPVSLLRS